MRITHDSLGSCPVCGSDKNKRWEIDPGIGQASCKGPECLFTASIEDWEKLSELVSKNVKLQTAVNTLPDAIDGLHDQDVIKEHADEIERLRGLVVIAFTDPMPNSQMEAIEELRNYANEAQRDRMDSQRADYRRPGERADNPI